MRAAAHRIRTILTTFALAGVALFVGFVPVVRGDGKPTEAIARDQRNIRLRLQELSEKMDRVATKLEREGRPFAVNLIRNGIAELKSNPVDKKMEEVEEILSKDEAPFRATTKQEEIIDNLENLLAILMDRRNTEKLDELRKQLQASLEKLETLRNEESKLREQTEQAEKGDSSSADADISEQAKKLNEMIREQESVQRETLEQNDPELARLEKADEAIRRIRDKQEQHLSETRDTKSVKGLDDLAKAAEALEKLLEDAQHAAAQETPSESAAREEAASHRDEMAKAAEAIQKSLEQAAPSSPSGDSKDAASKARQATESAKKALENAGQSLREGKPADDTKTSDAEAVARLEAAKEALDQALGENGKKLLELEKIQKDLAAETSDIADDLKSDPKSGGEKSDGSKPDGSKGSEGSPDESGSNDKSPQAKAGSELAKAAESMEQASKSLESGNPESAAPNEQKALDGLKKAADTIAQKKAELEAKQNDALAKAAEKQQELAKQAK
ncbi:MAG: hypothetical protein HYR85_23770, partial [Planctomycetes bacterium]|nr:hypothetical protein [Planctomycetota bacterium]